MSSSSFLYPSSIQAVTPPLFSLSHFSPSTLCPIIFLVLFPIFISFSSMPMSSFHLSPSYVSPSLLLSSSLFSPTLFLSRLFPLLPSIVFYLLLIYFLPFTFPFNIPQLSSLIILLSLLFCLLIFPRMSPPL